MTHNELWAGIRNLATEFNTSCSGLARAAGLDPTTFNKSKQLNQYGQNRWPTTYTISRILDAAGISLSEFATFLPSDTHKIKKCAWLSRCDKSNIPQK